MTITRPTEVKMVPRPNEELAAIRAQAGHLAVLTFEQTHRPETPDELRTRQDAYDTANGLLWALLIQVCEGEALTVIKSTPTRDGHAAWLALQEKYGEESQTMVMSMLLDLLNDKQGNKKVSEFVTEWRERLRRLADKEITFHPQLETVLFLNALGPSMQQYKTHHRITNATIVPAIYKEAIDFEKANGTESDEANNRQIAMQAHGSSKHATEGTRSNMPANMRACRYQRGCRAHKLGKCAFYHFTDHAPRDDRPRFSHYPKRYTPYTRRQPHGYKQPNRQDWQCGKCKQSNFAYRTKCFKCTAPKTSMHRAYATQETEDADAQEHQDEVEALREQLAEQQEQLDENLRQMEEAQRRADEADAGIDLFDQGGERAAMSEEQLEQAYVVEEVNTREAYLTQQTREARSNWIMMNGVGTDTKDNDRYMRHMNHEGRRAVMRWNRTHRQDAGTQQQQDSSATALETREEYVPERKRRRIRFKVDSGASRHFVGSAVDIDGRRPSDMNVMGAFGDSEQMEAQGELQGTCQSSTQEETNIRIPVQQHSKFESNLFSVKQAVNQGYKFVFDKEGSYLTTSDGTKVDLVDTHLGYELHLQ